MIRISRKLGFPTILGTDLVAEKSFRFGSK